MRKYAIPMLCLVLTMLAGACAGRQVRTRSIPAPSPTERAATVAAPAPVAEAPVAVVAPDIETDPVVEPAPAVPVTEEPKLTTQQMIDKYVADEIAAHDAWVRKAAEKLHRSHVPEPLPNNDEIVAALKIDAAHRAAYASRPRPKPKAAPPAEAGGREAAIGSVAVAPPADTQEGAAPAAPSIVNAAPGTPNVLAAPSSETVPLFVPDRTSVEQGRAYWSTYLAGAFSAAILGVLAGLFMGLRRGRRIRRLAAKPYDHLPHGTVLIQEVVDGELVTRQMFPAAPPAPRSEPEASEREAMMDSIEKTWHAQGDAIQQQTEQEIRQSPHDQFDLTDAYDDVPPPAPQATPAPPAPPAPPEPAPTPPPDAAPRLASGSGQMISSADGVLVASGVTNVPDPPREPRSEPEAHAKVILFEDDSTDIPAMLAAPTASN